MPGSNITTEKKSANLDGLQEKSLDVNRQNVQPEQNNAESFQRGEEGADDEKNSEKQRDSPSSEKSSLWTNRMGAFGALLGGIGCLILASFAGLAVPLFALVMATVVLGGLGALVGNKIDKSNDKKQAEELKKIKEQKPAMEHNRDRDQPSVKESDLKADRANAKELQSCKVRTTPIAVANATGRRKCGENKWLAPMDLSGKNEQTASANKGVGGLGKQTPVENESGQDFAADLTPQSKQDNGAINQSRKMSGRIPLQDSRPKDKQR